VILECNVWRFLRISGRRGERPDSFGSPAVRHDDRVPETGPESSRQTGLDTGEAPADPDLLIDLRSVSLRRSGRTLVGPLDWVVELDERWVIVGPNGAGKTSLLRIAAATEHPSSGVAYVLGERLGRVDVSELRARIGLSSAALAQRVPDDEVVRDLVVSAGYAVLGRWRERYEDVDYQRATDMLESLGAEHLAERSYGTLSEGERKRVQIARALMTDPELLLLDEPAAGLDLGGREELVARLTDLAADPDAPALVLVTHHVEEIPPGFSHCMLLAEGQVVAAGLLPDVLTAENLSTAFGQSIALEVVDGRYFARRVRSRAAHRRLL
jgi:iron complex transport system ATP-binding protein